MTRFAAMRLLFAIAGALLVACGHGPGSDGQRTSQVDVTVDVVGGPSLYAMHPALRDWQGLPFALDAFRGHPVLISMFYGSCPSACPLLVSNIARVDAELPAEVRAQTRVLLVSFDAEHDTPEALRAVAARHHLDPARWTLAAAGEDDARTLAAALGISYRALPGGGFSHTSVITALDREGRPIARAEGPSADLSPLARALQRAAQ